MKTYTHTPIILQKLSFIVLILIIHIATGSINAQSFAEIDISITLPEYVDVTLYVNPAHPNASDDNDGTTHTAPLVTIQQAVLIAKDKRKSDLSSRILIYPGNYREFVLINDMRDDLITIVEAVTPGTVTISGSDVWDGWQPLANQSNTYTHYWPYNWGPYPNPWKSVDMDYRARMREMIFVNGERMLQVFNRADLVTGSFYVDTAQDTVFLSPLADVDMSSALIEVGMREAVMQVSNAYNIILRGLTIEHAISGPKAANGALNARDCQNLIVEDSYFLNNNTRGLNIRRCDNVKVQHIVANHNGHKGINANQVNNLLIEDVEIAHNNWRGAMGGWYEWDAGQKFVLIHNGVFRNYRAFDNEATGLWFDIGNSNILVENAYICNNYYRGIFIEVSQGPITVRDSVICNTRNYGTRRFGNAGIFSTFSQNVILENNQIYGNDQYQIRLHEPGNRYRTIRDPRTDISQTLDFDNWIIRNNQIASTTSNQRLIYVPDRDDYDLLLENNQWFTPNDGNNFFRGNKSISNEQWQSQFSSGPILSLDQFHNQGQPSDDDDNTTLASITRFVLVNADTGVDIVEVTDNMTLDLNDLPTRNLNIRAETDPALTGSVQFALNENKNFAIDNTAPYALSSDIADDYLPWTPDTVSYTLTATPHSAPQAGGLVGVPSTVTVHFIDTFVNYAPQITALGEQTRIVGSPIALPIQATDPETDTLTYQATNLPDGLQIDTATGMISGSPTTVGMYNTSVIVVDSYDNSASINFSWSIIEDPGNMSVDNFTLVDASTNIDILTLTPDIVIDLANFSQSGINIRANVSGNVGSVKFSLNGYDMVDHENEAPYTLFGDQNGDYNDWRPATGAYTITATPYSQTDANGIHTDSLSISFTVVDTNTTPTPSPTETDPVPSPPTPTETAPRDTLPSQPAPDGRTCTLNPDNGILVSFGKRVVVGGKEMRRTGIPIPAGTYQITLQSYDERYNKNGVLHETQPQEQWRIEINGVFSNPIRDLGDLEASVAEVVQTNYVVSTPVNEVFAHHLLAGTDGESNSVWVVCALLTPIDILDTSVSTVKSVGEASVVVIDTSTRPASPEPTAVVEPENNESPAVVVVEPENNESPAVVVVEPENNEPVVVVEQPADPVAQTAQGTATCTLDPNAGILVHFGKRVVVGGKETRRTSINVPAGKYQITLQSYDERYNKNGKLHETQPQEQWRIEINGVLSNPIRDLGDRESGAIEMVQNNFKVKNDANEVFAHHLLAGTNNEPNSVIAVCALLTPR